MLVVITLFFVDRIRNLETRKKWTTNFVVWLIVRMFYLLQFYLFQVPILPVFLLEILLFFPEETFRDEKSKARSCYDLSKLLSDQKRK
ncbi:MAG: hypothetical protein ACFFD2_04680 [Promethearchaeota archaeon]